MRWRKVDDYHIESDTGYRIARYGPADNRTYSAWPPGARQAIQYSRSLEEVKQACEAHQAGGGVCQASG